MARIVKTFALVGALSLTVVLGSGREAQAAIACFDVEGFPCGPEGRVIQCYTGGTWPYSKTCQCFQGYWACS